MDKDPSEILPNASSPDREEERPERTRTLSVESDQLFIPGNVPGQVGHYRLVKKLGAGGMGEVYEAEQLEPVHRKVALKLIRLGMDSELVSSRFELERQSLAMMNHVNIAQIYDGGVSEQGRPYFVMEYVDGIPIDRYCDEQKLDTRKRLKLFQQICDGIQHAHQKGIIHRDIKPSNVLVEIRDNKAVPKIIDFGVAKATHQAEEDAEVKTQMGQIVGTPMYMSPEQVMGLDIDTRTDVYALGVLLYELLVGIHPLDWKRHPKRKMEEILHEICEVDPSRPSTQVSMPGDDALKVAERHGTDCISLERELRGDLDWITMKALEKERDRRYNSPSELSADIERYLTNEPVLASPPSTVYRVKKFVRRHKVSVAAAAIVLLALLTGITGTTVGMMRAVRAEKSATEEAENARQVSDFMVGLFEVSDPGEARGNTITAREVLDRGVEKIKQELQDQPLVQARLMDTMGEVYRKLGLLDKAESLARGALQTRIDVLGDNHIEVSKSLNSVANVLSERNDYDEARIIYERSLAINEKIYGSDHLKVADILNNLGYVLSGQGDFDGAIRSIKRALEIREKVLGPDDENVANTLNSLGAVYFRQGKYAEAEPLFTRTLAIREKLYDENHPNLAHTLSNLALIRSALGQYAGAKELLERALAIQEKVFEGNPDHSDLAAVLSNLAWVLRSMGKPEEAKPYLERAIKIQEKAAPKNPELARFIQNLGELMQETGDYKNAETLMERALAMRESLLGPEHVDTAQSLQGLAYFYYLQNRDEKAELYYKRALEILEKVLGPESVNSAWSLEGLGYIYSRQGRNQEAEPLFKRAIDIRTKVFGPEHSYVLDTMDGYAEVLRKLGRIDEAEKLEAQTKAIREKQNQGTAEE
jgi:serine/threonine protein kinase/tetratricopeptide (TPR) repeat protein